MKILSTGDWHFNAGYDDDVLASVQQVILYVAENPPGLIVITGDVYDRASEPGSRNIAADAIKHLADYAPVFIVRGNHDAPGDLMILDKIRSKYSVTVFETAMEMAYEEPGVMFHIIPWVTKSRWQSSHPEASKEEGDQTVSQMVLTYLRNNVALNPDYKHILVGHMTVAGAKAQNHQQMGADGVTIGLHDIAEAGFDAAMLGHIHLRQELGGPSYFYNGSIAALDYGETPDKYFSVYDTKTGKVEWIRLETIHRQDITARWASTGIVVDPIDENLINGSRVRANLRIEGGDNAEKAKEQLAEWLKNAGALEYKINPQVVPVSKVRASQISKATKLSDKLKQYWEATGFPDKETQKDMLDKLSELEDSCFL